MRPELQSRHMTSPPRQVRRANEQQRGPRGELAALRRAACREEDGLIGTRLYRAVVEQTLRARGTNPYSRIEIGSITSLAAACGTYGQPSALKST
jgi:hypothetical protein